MGIFTRKAELDGEAPAWLPTVDMATARPVIFALANARAASDAETGAAIARFVSLSERPSTEQLFRLAGNGASHDPDSLEQLLNRPWAWLAAAMRRAGLAGDHHLVLAGLFWACHWTSDLLPRNENLGALEELGLCPIAPALKAEILALGMASADRVPADFVVARNQRGQLLAGSLALTAPALLGR
jgi:hypothetical protein